MIELIYISKASERYSIEDLQSMLRMFRQNNESKDITGLLLYNNRGTFLQLLEGEAPIVNQLYEVIKKDTRHSSLVKLKSNTIDSRSFPDWKMGFRYLSERDSSALPGFSDFLDNAHSSQDMQNKPEFAAQIFTHFKKKAYPSASIGTDI